METSNERLARVLIESLAAGVAAYAAAEAYKRWVPRDAKKKFEETVKTHHGEAGVGLALVGTAALNPAAIGAGIGLMVHDRKDASKWLKDEAKRGKKASPLL